MQLAHATWPEVAAYLEHSDGIILPIGSTEQHGPVGLIGTDAMVAQEIATVAGEKAGALVAPVIGYTPAEFNMDFPGTISVSVDTFQRLVGDVVDALARHGFGRIYVLNGHGANLEPLRTITEARSHLQFRIASWWAYPNVERLRNEWYGKWEGMHATPSEVAITRAVSRQVDGSHLPPPEPITAEFVQAHAGDRHGPPSEHRAQFPDGRVGSHSDLGTAEQGRRLVEEASTGAAADYAQFVSDGG